MEEDSTVLEKEKSICYELNNERQKYLQNRNLKGEKIANSMPVTNVVTSIRKINANQINKCITIEGKLLENENIGKQSSILSMRNLNKKYENNECYNPTNRTMNEHKCKQSAQGPFEILIKNILNEKNSVLRKSNSNEGKKNETCKCCGSNLIKKQNINLVKDRFKGSYNEGDENQYQETKDDNSTKNCKHNMKQTSSINEGGEEEVVCNKDIMKNSFDNNFNHHNGDNLLIFYDPTELCIKHRQLYEDNHNDDTTIDKCVNHNIENVQMNLNLEEAHCKLSNAKENNYKHDWREEAKNILIHIGESINIGNNIERRPGDVRKEEISAWAYGKWKHYTENNKNRKLSLEKLKINRENALSFKYFSLWKNKIFLLRKKRKQERADKIDTFLQVLKTKQNESKQNKVDKKENGKNNRPRKINYGVEYEHRLTVKKDIINTQKQKLAEAEEEINKLKLKQILVESKISKNKVKENIRETIENINPKLKITANQIMRVNVSKKDNDKAKELVERMEMRSKERKLKWEAIKERKKHKEEEKIKRIQEEETARVKEEEERKLRKILERKEQRRKERENDIQRELERRRLNSLTVIAENFYKKRSQLKAIRALQENVKKVRENMSLAERFHIFKLKQNYFLSWKMHMEESRATKQKLADHFYNYILKRRVFDAFKELYNLKILNFQVAIDFRELKLQEKYLKKWVVFYLWRQKNIQYQMRQAALYHERKLLGKCFRCWTNLPEILFHEREKEKRLREWRDKVKEVLPDFVPFQVE